MDVDARIKDSQAILILMKTPLETEAVRHHLHYRYLGKQIENQDWISQNCDANTNLDVEQGRLETASLQ